MHIPNIRADIVRSDALINIASDGCSLLYAQEYVRFVKHFLEARYPFWRRVLAARIGIGVIISEHEISDAVKLYCQLGVSKDISRNIHVIPILVDLEEQSITTPLRVGHRGGYELGRNVRFARERFSLTGHSKEVDSYR